MPRLRRDFPNLTRDDAVMNYSGAEAVSTICRAPNVLEVKTKKFRNHFDENPSWDSNRKFIACDPVWNELEGFECVVKLYAQLTHVPFAENEVPFARIRRKLAKASAPDYSRRANSRTRRASWRSANASR